MTSNRKIIDLKHDAYITTDNVHDFENITDRLYTLLPEDQIKVILNSFPGDAELNKEFLGFVDIYYYLSKIIPVHFTVIDFGCAYNAQCFFFNKHKQYIAIDYGFEKVFQSENSTFYNMTTKEYIDTHLHSLNINTTFAICSYVPNWHHQDSIALVKENFRNIYTFYPSR